MAIRNVSKTEWLTEFVSSSDSESNTGTTDRATLKIVPGPTAIDATALPSQFKRLHGIDSEFTLEIQLCTRGDAVEYYVRTDSEHIDRVERALRRAFPRETSIESASLPNLDLTDESSAAMELYGNSGRRGDWQTGLQPLVERSGDRNSRRNTDTASNATTEPQPPSRQFPLASVVDTMVDADSDVVYQAVIKPKPSWDADAETRIDNLLKHRDTYGQRFSDLMFDDYDDDPDPSKEDAHRTHRKRIDAIEVIETDRSFSVNVRAVASGPDAEVTLEELGNVFRPVDGEYYRVVTDVQTDADSVSEIAHRVREGVCRTTASLGRRLCRRLPVAPNPSPEIVADPATVPLFCLLDGDALTTRGERALQATPAERTGVALPDDGILSRYDVDGLLLGRPLDVDRTIDDRRVAVPPSLQPLHTAWVGKTGSGKTTALINAILLNHYATAGADILFDSKGDGMPIEYLKAHYAAYGTLENVYYFDCARVLPAIAFFDIREQLDAGIPRATAVENIVDHYIEILEGLTHGDNFESAIRSPDVIRFLVKAMFDQVHRGDYFSHRDLHEAAARMRRTGEAPTVSNPSLDDLGSGIGEDSTRTFDKIMQGVVNRMDKIRLDARLDLLFNHVHDHEGDAGGDAGDSSFDFREVIDENAVVIVDTGGLRAESQGAVTRVLLSKLWTALQRRTRESNSSLDETTGTGASTGTGEAADLPLVNVYLEEAASLTTSSLLSELLSQSRSFGVSMTLAMQYPQQFKADSEAAYNEVLNNVSTIVTGNVSVDRKLARTLSTPKMATQAVENRLGALRRGEWLASLPACYGEPEPRPFLLESEEMPPGHPDGDAPLSEVLQSGFHDGIASVQDRSRETHGLDIQRLLHQARMTHPDSRDDSSSDDDEDGPRGFDPDARTDSALPYTVRMPDGVSYDADSHSLACRCGSQFDPTSEGMRRAVTCCGDREAIDRDNVPICELDVTMSDDERRQTRCTDAQLRFLHAVDGAHQGRFDPELEYNLIDDSMYRLKEYVGLSNAELEALIDWDLIWQDCSQPHTLFTVSPEGRAVANIQRHDGAAHGEGEGDIRESSLHVAMVHLAVRYIQQEYVADDDSAAVRVATYLEVDGHRLDVAALDKHGNIVVTAEAERQHAGLRRRVPDDYDKMAGHDPEAAIWVVPHRDTGHDILEALNDPQEGEPRVEKTYSDATAPHDFTIAEPGLTDVLNFRRLRDSILQD